LTSLLLDTHALLWALGDPDRLSSAARSVLESRATPAYASAASVWEISIKRRSGKLTAPDDLIAQAEEAGFDSLPIAASHAWRAGELPLHHRDPFDRMLIAQALADGLTVVTKDPVFASYGVPTLW
jgi:PIN domain nuclease of toxin-antitoxin system